jgi:hypothetical protein
MLLLDTVTDKYLPRPLVWSIYIEHQVNFPDFKTVCARKLFEQFALTLGGVIHLMVSGMFKAASFDMFFNNTCITAAQIRMTKEELLIKLTLKKKYIWNIQSYL